MVLSRHVALLRIIISILVRLAADCVLLWSNSWTSAAEQQQRRRSGRAQWDMHAGCLMRAVS